MTEEVSTLICQPLAATKEIIHGSVTIGCADCGAEIVCAPSGQKKIEEGWEAVCVTCGYKRLALDENVRVNMPTVEQILEIQAHRRRQ